MYARYRLCFVSSFSKTLRNNNKFWQELYLVTLGAWLGNFDMVIFHDTAVGIKSAHVLKRKVTESQFESPLAKRLASKHSLKAHLFPFHASEHVQGLLFKCQIQPLHWQIVKNTKNYAGSFSFCYLFPFCHICAVIFCSDPNRAHEVQLFVFVLQWEVD